MNEQPQSQPDVGDSDLEAGTETPDAGAYRDQEVRPCGALGLAQDVEMAVADISGAFLQAVLEKHFFVTPPAGYRKPGVVWKINRYLYGDKRAPRGWQAHFEKTMLELGFERLESEPVAS